MNVDVIAAVAGHTDEADLAQEAQMFGDRRLREAELANELRARPSVIRPKAAHNRDAAGMTECLREMGEVTVGIDPFDWTEVGESAVHRETTIVRTDDSAQQEMTRIASVRPQPMAPGHT